jgi:hypothetical protein
MGQSLPDGFQMLVYSTKDVKAANQAVLALAKQFARHRFEHGRDIPDNGDGRQHPWHSVVHDELLCMLGTVLLACCAGSSSVLDRCLMQPLDTVLKSCSKLL